MLMLIIRYIEGNLMVKKYKIAVYAISKNEEKNVYRWYEAMKEADEIYVLDTGSDDKTVTILKELGVHVSRVKIEPWRFDEARNKALEMVSDEIDICVSTDLDEVFLPGWYEKIQEIWTDDTTRLKYTYNWQLEGDRPVVSFLYDKIHARHGYKWIYPVHEVLSRINNHEVVKIDKGIVLNHYPDRLKSRSYYLDLLELSVREDSENDRNMHYLGREYMYNKEWDKCINTLKKHLTLKKATWIPERAASMRFIARSYQAMDNISLARMWYKKAIDEDPSLRDGYVELAILEYHQGNYLEVINNLILAKSIKSHELIYINEPFSWDYTIDNLLSVVYYNLGLYDEALYYIDKALMHDKDNEMLINNREIIMKEKESN